MLPGAQVIERAALSAWPGIESEWDGQWVRRAALGYTHRANSMQSLDAADDADARERIGAAVRWFEARGLPPVFRVTPLTGPGIVAALDGLGWDEAGHSLLMAMELGSIESDPEGELLDANDPVFHEAQQELQGYSDETTGKMARLLAAIAVPARGVVWRGADGHPVASSIMSVADGILITGNVVTAPSERRRGHGAAMMRTGLAWARSVGAEIAALNVAAGNVAAQALYRRLGYEVQYGYHYRVSA